MARTLIISWLAVVCWAMTFMVILAPTFLGRAEVIRRASTDQLLDAQIVAFQSATPLIYATVALSAFALISAALDERRQHRQALAEQLAEERRARESRKRNAEQLRERWSRDREI